MDQRNRNSEEMTIRQKTEFARSVAIYPALSILVFMRRKIGFRFLKMSGLVVTAFVMFLYAEFWENRSPSQGAPMLRYYAIAMLIAAAVQRILRWRELSKGIRWHTYSPGLSVLEFIPKMPRFLRAYRRIYRFLDPMLALLIGNFVAGHLSRPLGNWIVLSAICLVFVEHAIYERQLEYGLDAHDSLVVADVQSDTIKFFSGPQPKEQAHTEQQTGGIATGVAPDIQRQLEMRRAKLKAPDNLAVDSLESRL